MSKLSLNDLVEQAHLSLYHTSQDYRAFLYAVYDEQAVEGSLSADNVMAAEKLRDFAREHDDLVDLAKEKLATISKALGVVLRRYKSDRKSRKNMLGGNVIPMGDDSAE